MKTTGNPAGKKGELGKKGKAGPYSAVAYVPHPKTNQNQNAMPLNMLFKRMGGRGR